MSRLPQPGDRWDRYEILEELGRGGYGRVYRAHDPRLDRDVAVKVLSTWAEFRDEDLQRFRRERRMAAKLRHPNVVQIYDGGERDGVLYHVMSYVDGHDLRHELRDGPLPIGRVRSVVDQVARALDHAHDSGLVHRDVKPGNVLCEGDSDRVYLADFGISRPVDQTTENRITRGGHAPASYHYVAPEQLHADQRVDARTDVYALGCLLYECLTGRRPFEGDIPALVHAHVNATPPRVTDARPELSHRWNHVVATALAKTPSRRFQRCGELRAAVDILALEHEPAEPSADDTRPTLPADADADATRGDHRTDPTWSGDPIRSQQRATPYEPTGTHGRARTVGPGGAWDDSAAYGRPPSSGARTVPDQTPAWRRVALAGLVLAVAGLGAWFFWPALTGSASSADPPAPAASPPPSQPSATVPASESDLTAGQRALVDAVGVFAAVDCRAPTSEPYDGQDAAVACANDTQAPTNVVYRRFTDISSRDAGFDRIVRSLDGLDGPGDCRAGVDTLHGFTGTDGRGRIVCNADDEVAGLTWTVPDQPVLASSRIDDPDADVELYRWWHDLVDRRADDRLPDCPTDDSLVERGAEAAVACDRTGGVTTVTSYAQFADREAMEAWFEDNFVRLQGPRGFRTRQVDAPEDCEGLGEGDDRDVAARTTWSGDGAGGGLICFVNGLSRPADAVNDNVLFWTDDTTAIGSVAVAPTDDSTLVELVDEWRTAGYRTVE